MTRPMTKQEAVNATQTLSEGIFAHLIANGPQTIDELVNALPPLLTPDGIVLLCHLMTKDDFLEFDGERFALSATSKEKVDKIPLEDLELTVDGKAVAPAELRFIADNLGYKNPPMKEQIDSPPQELAAVLLILLQDGPQYLGQLQHKLSAQLPAEATKALCKALVQTHLIELYRGKYRLSAISVAHLQNKMPEEFSITVDGEEIPRKEIDAVARDVAAEAMIHRVDEAQA